MTLTRIFFTLIIAALLPTFAYATDTISASGERGPHCKTATTTVVMVDKVKKADPMEAAVKAMVNSTTDPVLASYYRDLYRAPGSYESVQFVRTPDPYVDAITVAFYGMAEPDSRLIC